MTPAAADTTPPPVILLVEDDLDARRALSHVLRRAGVEVLEAATLADGVAGLAHRPTHLILDLDLPDGAGGELLERVRATGLPVRVAVYTGSPDLVLGGEAARAGPDAFFHKPVDRTRLLRWATSSDA